MSRRHSSLSANSTPQKNKNPWIKRVAIGLAGLILVLCMYAFVASQNSKSVSLPPTDPEDSALGLQVDKSKTVQGRADFTKEFQARKGYQLRDLFEKWITPIGANGIIDSIEAVEPLCHDRAHDLGKLIYSKIQDVGDSLRVCQDSCNSGCMHGVLMEFFLTKNIVKEGADHIDLPDLKTQMSSICGDADKEGDPAMKASYKQGDCVHGVGHALMFLSDYNIKKAMEYCSLFASDVLDYYCATGAYMEYHTVNDIRDTMAHPENAFFPCNSGDYPAACFRYKMAHIVPRVINAKGKIGQLQEACLSLSGKYLTGCFHGLGNGSYGLIAKGYASIDKLCAAGTNDDQYACIEGSIERIARYQPEVAKHQCTLVDGWKRDLCLEDVSHALYDLNKPFELYVK